METIRVLDRPEDFKKYGIKQKGLEAWEDGRRDSPEPGHKCKCQALFSSVR